MTNWISSFPRSGNTLLRQVLHAGWGVLSGSIYPEDLGDNADLIRLCGHVELPRLESAGGLQLVNPHNVFVKSHQVKPLKGKTIYIMRDGRAACVSLWHFLKRTVPIEQIIRGESFAGLWSDNLISHIDQADLALQLRYEDLVADPSDAIRQIAGMLGKPVGDPRKPLEDRDAIAAKAGKWVRRKSDWTQDWNPERDALFWQHNAPAMERFYPEIERTQ